MESAVLISYRDNDAPVGKRSVSIILNAVEDTNISATSTVTMHPTVYGTSMADHMYRNPVVLTLRGTFSLNGKKMIVIDKAGRSLANVEKMFEDIKNRAIVCNVSKIIMGDASIIPQFTNRTNMVLSDISWTEKINSLDFTFTFQEVLRVNVESAEIDPDDNFTPDITYPESSSFTDELLDISLVNEQIMKAIIDYELATDEFLEFMSTITSGALIGIGIGAAAAISLTTTLVALGVSTGGIALIGVAIAGVITLILNFDNILDNFKRLNYKIDIFKYYKNDKKRDKEVKRFGEFYENIYNLVEQLNDYIKLWSVTENKPQETILSIDNSYYVFDFERNNVDSGYAYKLNISDINDKTIKCTNTNCAINSFSDGNMQNYLFYTGQSWVYLIREPVNDPHDLRSYYICATTINPVDFSNTLLNIITEAIVY